MERRPLKSFGMFTESDYTNKNLETCTKLAEENGYNVRVIEQDGESFIFTMEARVDRINVRVKRGVVTNAYVG